MDSGNFNMVRMENIFWRDLNHQILYNLILWKTLWEDNITEIDITIPRKFLIVIIRSGGEVIIAISYTKQMLSNNQNVTVIHPKMPAMRDPSLAPYLIK